MDGRCFCDTPIRPGQKFCTGCGTPLPEPKVEEQGPPETEKAPGLDPRLERWTGGHPKVWIAVLVVLVLIIGLAVVAGQSTEGTTSEGAPRPSATSSAPARSIARLSDDLAAAITSGISGYPEVLEAAVVQDGDLLNLVLIVGYQTNEARARQLGDNFVRLAKSLLGDGGVGTRIGRGEYDYLVGVYYRNEELVAMGAKVGGADRLSW